MRPISRYLYIFSAAAAVSHAAYFFSQMPSVMAVHFGSSGMPDGFSSKETFFAILFGMIFLNIVVFAVGPWIIERRRIRRLSVPNRGFWLSPENLGDFYAFFRERMAWFGIASLLFLGVVDQLVFVANLAAEPRLDESLFLLFLTAYFGFVIIWLFTFFRKIAKAGKKEV